MNKNNHFKKYTMSNLRKATRQKAKIRLGLSAVSGGGKTYSALLIASGMAAWDKIALIDTENGSGDLYSHMGGYNVLTLSAPFTPERYVEAIQDCENAGVEVIIIDSITHEWDGAGGILEIHSNMTGNSFTNWSSLTPRHQKFINAILQSKCHIITTVRRKQDYELSVNDKGKAMPVKVGLKEVTREGFEYELTANLELDVKHNATVSKDRTGLFAGQPPFTPSAETGKLIMQWCESGIDTIAETRDAILRLLECNTVAELTELKQSLPSYITGTDAFKNAGKDRYQQITDPGITSPSQPAPEVATAE